MSGSIRKARLAMGPDGEQANVFTLTSRGGMEVVACSFGGIILSIRVPDRYGRLEDVALGFADLADYRTNAPYFGALVGRYANRIAGACFTLDGATYTLAANDGPNHLHGGRYGFGRRVWRARPFRADRGVGIVLRYDSPAGEEGYPGTLRTRVTYTLTDGNALVLDYAAVTDRPTPVNLTQHSYVNLGGHGAGDVLDHVVTVNANRFTPVDDALIPTGELRPVAGSAFDLRRPVALGERIALPNEQLAIGGGFDHNFVLADTGRTAPAFAARVLHPATGRQLEVHTTEPGLQLYTGNHLGGEPGKEGVRYGRHAGVALETQHFPDSPNRPEFPSTILRPGGTYRSRTVLRFGIG